MKITPILFIIALTFLPGCQQGSMVKKGMIQVAIMYPNGVENTFDMEYYEHKHMPMLAELYGDLMHSYRIDKGISGRTPEDATPFLAVGHMYFETLADYREGFSANAEQILGDIPNYTNIQPIIQISEVVR